MIAPEGKLIVGLLLLAMLALHLTVGIIVWPLWGLVIAFAYLYRNPRRTIPSAPLGAYVLRAITEGKIMQHWLHETDSETQGHLQHAIWIQTDEQDDVIIAIHAGGRFRRMHCYASVGERVGQGKRCGFIPFGTRIDIILPIKARSKINVGDKVLAGSDLIGEFVH